MLFSSTKYRSGLQRGITLALIMALLLGLVAEFFGPGLSPAQAAGTVSLDPAFTVGNGFNSTVKSLAIDSNGKVVVGGYFTTYDGLGRKFIARLKSDGTLDTSFNVGTGFDNNVVSLAIQSDGKVIVGGDFTNYNGTARSRIARLNTDGSLDTLFNIGTGFDSPSPSVESVVIQSDGKIVVGGDFTSYNGTARSRIARLNTDGSLDTNFAAFGTGFNNTVYSMVIDPLNNIVVGGDFISYNGISRRRIARLNSIGGLDSSFTPTGTGFNSTVYSLAISNGGVIAGGTFTNYNTVASPKTANIVRLNGDGSLDTSFALSGSGFDGAIYGLTTQSDGKIVVGGNFTNYNGAARNRIARLNSNGSLDSAFTVGNGFNSDVYSLATDSTGKIVVGGDFVTFDGSNSAGIARVKAPAATKLVISGLPATPVVGTPVTFTVTAQDASNATFPTYSATINLTSSNPNVSFSDSYYTFTAADAGVKTFTVTFYSLGSQTITITDNSTPVLTVTSPAVMVKAPNSTVNLSISPNPASVGQPLTLTATVAAVSGSGTPTGTVSFFCDNSSLNVPGTLVSLVNKVATLTFTPATTGSCFIYASYNGDSTYDKSASANLTLTINSATTLVGSYYHKLTPFRLYDDRPAGTNTPNPPLGVAAAAFKANETRTLAVNGLNGLPSSGIKAITANITIISAGPGAGFLTAFPTTDSNGVALTRPGTANLAWSNPAVATLLSNFATISVDNSGKFNVYVGVAAADVIIDVTGYYSSDSSGTGTGIYRNVDSTQKTFRLYDSRPAGTNAVAPPLGAGDGILAAGKSRTLQVTGNLGIPASASAVVVNLTALNTKSAAFFNLYPSDASQPGVASLTFIPGSPALVGNLALVPLSLDGKMSLAAGGLGSADAILDVVGYVDTNFTISSNNGLYTSLTSPTRLLDTRAKGTNPTDPPLGAGAGPQQGGTANIRNFVASGKVGIPTNAIALVAQVTMVNTSGPSFIGLYSGSTWPGTVAVANAVAGQLPGNLAIIPLDNAGSFNAILGPNASNYIIDVVGYISGS